MTLAKELPHLSDVPGVRDELRETPWRTWLAILLLALLLHALAFRAPIHWSGVTAPPRVELQDITPEQLKKIRDRWKQLPVLIDRDKSRRSEKEAPKDARYMSDRNIKVEKEQRARREETRPEVGSPQVAKPAPARPPHGQPREAHAPTRPLPSLGNLGIAYNLTARPPMPEGAEDSAPQAPSSDHIGGQQYVDDRNLPEGSENLLNAAESVYYSFFARVREQIAPIWYSMVDDANASANPRPGDYDTLVDVTLDPQGNVVNVDVIQSSGVAQFDRVAVACWRKAERFPNPPTGLLDAARQLHFNFGFRFTAMGGGVRLGAPVWVH